MTRLFTARYFNPNVRRSGFAPVRITLGAPKFPLRYELADSVVELAPSGWMFKIEERNLFSVHYFRKMELVGADWIEQRLRGISEGWDRRPVVLLCYEDVRKPGEWCHRLVFAEWWLRKTGQEVPELPEDWDGLQALLAELGDDAAVERALKEKQMEEAREAVDRGNIREWKERRQAAEQAQRMLF